MALPAIASESADNGSDLSTPASAITEGAPIVLLVDMESGQTLFQRNAERRFIPASITKVMSLYVAFDLIEAGKLDPQGMMEFRETSAQEWQNKGSTLFLEPGEQVSVDTLLRGIAAVSANDGAVTLAEGASGSVDAWVARMNKTARELGMVDSHFATPNGWPDGGATFTTARDLELLAEAIITDHPELYREYIGLPGLAHNGRSQANYDPISNRVEGADGIKTGFTNQAGNGFLGSANRDGSRLIMVVAGVDQQADRDRISRELIEWGFSDFERSQLFAAGTRIGTARVQNGALDNVGLVTPAPVTLARVKGDTTTPELSIRYEGPLSAPVAQGEEVAMLRIAVDGLPPADVPLIAAHDVSEAGFFERIANAFAGWFE